MSQFVETHQIYATLSSDELNFAQKEQGLSRISALLITL